MPSELRERELRHLFPAATGEPGPENVAELRKRQVRDALQGRGGLVLAYALLQLFAPLASFVAFGGLAPALLAGGLLLLVPLVFFGVQSSQAEAEFWSEYARTRGLAHRAEGALQAECPLYSLGDEQRFEHVLSGAIGSGRGALAHFVYTEIHRDSKGRKSRTDYPFTVVHFELPPEVGARFRGVYLRERSFSFGKLQDYFAHDRAVNLASAEFDELYSLRVVDEQDDVALYELFSTTFLDALIRTFHATWEQRDRDLVVFETGRLADAADLDDLCQRAANVLERYLEEHR